MMRPAETSRLATVRSSTVHRAATMFGATILLALAISVADTVRSISPAGAQDTAPAGAQDTAPASGDGAAIGGRVADAAGDPAVGLRVELFTASADATPGRFLRPAFTAGDGSYRFDDLAADCYVVVFRAPPGAAFGAGLASSSQESCIDPGQMDESVDDRLTTGRPGRPFTLNLLHIGDHHSHLKPDTIGLEIAGQSTEAEIGGMARVATKMSERTTALGPENVVRVHTGDSLSGTILYTIFGGAADAAALNAVCFDLVALGRQDLAQGAERLGVFLDFLADGPCNARVLAVQAEIPSAATSSAATPPIGAPTAELDRFTTIHSLGSNLVGFVPVPSSLRRADSTLALDPERPLDPDALAELVAITQARIDLLVQRGITNIVVVSNVGLENDVALAGALSDVDAVLGGGSHTLLGDFSPLGLEVAGRYPERTENGDGDPVCIGHAWQYAMVVGELNLDFDGAGTVTSCGGQAHLLLATVEPDPVTAATIAGYIDALVELGDQALGTVTEELCFTPTPSRSVGLLCGADVIGDSGRRPADVQLLIAEAIRERTGAEVGVVNSGIVDQGLGSGPLRIDVTYGVLAGEHSIWQLTMTGSELAATIEEAISAALDQDGSLRAYPHVAGLRWTYDRTAAPGGRVGELQIRSADGASWNAVAPENSYSVASVGSLARGGSGYATMAAVTADGRGARTSVEYAQALIDYIEQDLGGVISPADETLSP